jgi:hypothetical protein
MENIERRAWREARAMTRREVITKAIVKQLIWVQAAEIIGVKPRQMRRIRWRVEHYGLTASMMARASSGSRSSISSIEPLMSAKSAVTVLRSPSRAAELSASDAVMGGVDDRGPGDPGPSAVVHWPQNLRRSHGDACAG